VVGTDGVGSAVGAAEFSFATFASGAVFDPALPFRLRDPWRSLPPSWSGWRCSPLGPRLGVLTGGPLLRRGLRQLGIGVAAAAVTYGLGRVFGTVVG
jgi:VIT1/CCC1 family predicted Fe2+/Mn2+ transporter